MSRHFEFRRSRPPTHRRGPGRGQRNHQKRNPNQNSNDTYTQQSDNFIPVNNTEYVNHQESEDWKPLYNRTKGNQQFNRSRGNFKSNNFERRDKRSHSSSSSSSNKTGTDGKIHAEHYFTAQERNTFDTGTDRLPKHAQNPIFVNELSGRFNSLLPSFDPFESDVPQSVHPRVLSNQDNNVHTFASVSNDIDYRSRNSRSRNSDHSLNTNRNHLRRNNSHTRSMESDLQTHLRNYNDQSNFSTDSYYRSPDYMYTANEGRRPPFNMSTDNDSVYSGSNDIQVKSQPWLGSINNNRLSGSATNIEGNLHPEFSAGTGKSQPVPSVNIKSNSKSSEQRSQHDISTNTGTKLQGRSTSIEKRKENLIGNGFTVDHVNQNPTNKYETYTQQNSSTPPTSSIKFSSPVEEPESCRIDSKYDTSYSNKSNSGKKFSSQNDKKKTGLSFELSKQIEIFNNFSKFQNFKERENSFIHFIQQEPERLQRESTDPLNMIKFNTSTCNSSELTHGDIAGKTSFNIQRPVNDANEKVSTRSQAVQRIQSEYNIRCMEHEAKVKEKEAKKREEYLARYQYVDQGHPLTEGLLDEAAGCDPEFTDSLENVRQRQQEQLMRDAIKFQDQERLENERRKRREEQKQEEWLNRHKHIDAGFKLGHKTNYEGHTGNAKAANPVSAVKTDKEAQEKTEQLLSQLEMLMGKTTKPPPLQVESNSQIQIQPEVQPIKPVSCVIKTPRGPILVLRPTEDALNKTLMERTNWEVWNEMDKCGHSSLYKHEIEQEPLYTNKRFERKPLAETIAKATGAIPKQKSSVPTVVPTSATVTLPASKSGPAMSANAVTHPAMSSAPAPPQSDEPIIDYQAEMRAIRLRMQQKYEESLKQNQDNS